MLARAPWRPPLKVKPRRLNRDKRKHLVETVMAILKSGEPTLFAFEASCRHGLRSRLTLEGWGWQDADNVASDIVATALRQCGAQRPSWAEGQPEYVQNGGGALIERTRCVRCHSKLEGEQMKFCSTLCASAHHMHLAAVRQADEGIAYDRIAAYRTRAKCA